MQVQLAKPYTPNNLTPRKVEKIMPAKLVKLLKTKHQKSRENYASQAGKPPESQAPEK